MKSVGKANQRWLGLIILLFVVSATSLMAQEPPTATPAQINIATAAPTGADDPLAIPTATATTEGQIFIEARDFANVRAQPDTGAAQLGQIRSGELYPVIGRYFQWFQFVYEPSPTGLGWVFGDLVNIVGDVNAIPELDLSTQPTFDPVAVEQTSTQGVITLTPGGILTVTAFTRIMESNPDAMTPVGQGALPTFTYPPNVVRATATANLTNPAVTQTAAPQERITLVESSGLPPIIPILVLLGFGILGLAVSTIRK
jgi:hypothetical protein